MGTSRSPAELDAAQVRAAKAGDRQAARALVRCYHNRVYRLACRAAGQPSAEDVTQETFIRAFRSLARFDPDGSARVSTWILGIAGRAAIDHLRRRQTRAAYLAAIPAPPDPEQPDASLARSEVGALVAAAVQTLSPEIRTTFVLRAYHELTMPEIASALEVELGTVKSRLFRARQTLQEKLGSVWSTHAKGDIHVAG